MAIHPLSSPAPAALPTGGVSLDIQAWTEEASEAISTLQIHDVHDSPAPAPAVRAVTIVEIPLDDQQTKSREPEDKGTAQVHTVNKRQVPVRRDSLNRREALLKGKEGSRQRRRWENDRLMGNPYVQPPLPSDWEVRPTHTRHNPVPYYLAQLWDSGLSAQVSKSQRRAQRHAQALNEENQKHHVSKDFKAAMKKSKGAKSLLRDFENEVRGFVEQLQEREKVLDQEGLKGVESDEDDEVVFVGRNGAMHDRLAVKAPAGPSDEEVYVKKQLLLLDSAADDSGASFCRYLIHHIGSYYGLSTWSVTTGTPPRREAYVGLNARIKRAALGDIVLPRPLYGLV